MTSSDRSERRANTFRVISLLPSRSRPWARRFLGPCWGKIWLFTWKGRLQWWKLARNRRLRHLLHKRNAVKVTLGAGTATLPGWIDTDYRPLSNRTLYLDVTKRFPFADESVDYFHTEHMIEHLSLSSSQFLLRECYRTLKPGGKIRIATPDITRINQILIDPNDTETAEYIKWALAHVPPDAEPGTDLTPCMVFNNFMRNWGHQFIYDGTTLTALLNKAGFVSVRRSEVNTSEDRNFIGLENRHLAIGEKANNFETMVFEATKTRQTGAIQQRAENLLT